MTKPHPKNKYGVYCIPNGVENRPAAKAVIAGKVFEPKTVRFMCQNARDGDIIHAGTFFGDFLPALSNALEDGKKVWAFEPNPANHQAAKKTISLNSINNVELSNAALSNIDGEMLFRTHDKNGAPLGGISHHVDEGGEGVEIVKAVMLDYHVPLKRKVSILQLDVEGCEKQALKGAFHIIHRWKPVLILEYFSQKRWIYRTFRGLGYEHRGKLHSNHVYSPNNVSFD